MCCIDKHRLVGGNSAFSYCVKVYGDILGIVAVLAEGIDLSSSAEERLHLFCAEVERQYYGVEALVNLAVERHIDNLAIVSRDCGCHVCCLVQSNDWLKSNSEVGQRQPLAGICRGDGDGCRGCRQA